MITLTGIICLIFTLWQIPKIRRNGIINPLLLVVLQHFIFFGYDQKNSERPAEFQVLIATCTTLYLAAFWLISTYTKSSDLSKLTLNTINISGGIGRHISESNIIKFSAAALAFNYLTYWYLYEYNLIAVLLRMYSINFDTDRPYAALIVATNNLFIKLLLACIFICRYLELTKERRTKKSYIVFTIFLMIAIPLGTRGNILLAGIAFFLGGMVFKARHGKLDTSRSTQAIIASCLVLFAALSLLRSQDLTSDDFSLSSTLQESFQKQGDKEISPTVNDHLYFTLTTFNSKLEPLGPDTFFGIATNLIPRSIWSDKPIGFGKRLAMLDGGTLEGPSYAAGYIGEGWANFGLLGTFVFAIIFGSISGFLGGLALRFLLSGKIIAMIVGLLLYNSSIIFVRGDMLSAWAQGVYPVAISFMLLWLYRVLSKQTQGT